MNLEVQLAWHVQRLVLSHVLAALVLRDLARSCESDLAHSDLLHLFSACAVLRPISFSNSRPLDPKLRPLGLLALDRSSRHRRL